MSTDARRNANRKNASRSTGPRTLAGKTRVARNAEKHGLSIPVSSFPALQQEIEELTRLIAGNKASPCQLELARAVAEAQVELNRIRTVRIQMLNDAETFKPIIPESDIFHILRYGHLGQELDEDDEDRLSEAIRHLYDRNELWRERSFEEKLARADRKLSPLERYERRAISRRKYAIRRFHEAEALLEF